ncbi:MAG: DnaD domain protein [Eubacteriales bacterium]|nr:DnaD domain protein [Eubacteriales bacterium]
MKHTGADELQITLERQAASGEFLIPERLILKYLAELSGPALKLFLILQYVAQCHSFMPGPEEIQALAGFGRADYQNALNELLTRQLLRFSNRKYFLQDLRFDLAEVVPTVKREELRAESADAEVAAREEVIRQINDKFFSGTMGSTAYHDIERWFSEYQFSPYVVYAIFSEAEYNGAKGSLAYMRAIADNWHRLGIRSYEDLNAHMDQREEGRSLKAEIKKRLNQHSPLTSYQEELIDKWSNEWGFDFAVIDRALAETAKTSNANLAYVDKILQSWHEVGIKDIEGAEQYMANWQRWQNKRESRRSQKPRNVKNFKGRGEKFDQQDGLQWLDGNREDK